MTDAVDQFIAQANAAQQRGDLATADRAFRQALAAGPHDVQALAALGVFCHQTGRHAEAVAHLTGAVSGSEPSPSLFLNRGLARHALRDFVAAAADYRRALELKPDFAMAHNSLGVSLLSLGEQGPAMQAFLSAVRVDPGYARAHFNLGTIRKEAGDLSGAVESFARACAVQPTFVQAFASMAAALADQGDLDRALETYKAAVALNPKDPVVLNNIGMLLLKCSRLEEARTWLSAAVAAAPNDASVVSNLGTVLQRLKDPTAIKCFEQSFRLRPDERILAYNLMLSVSTGNLDAIDPELARIALKRTYPKVFVADPVLDVKISPAKPLEQWIREAGVESREIEPAQEVCLTYGDPPSEDRYVVEATPVYAIHGAEIISGWDYVIAPDGSVLDGSGYMPLLQPFGFMPHAYSRQAAKVIHPWREDAVAIDAPALFLSTPQHFHIGHWILDFLPRLRGIDAFGQSPRPRIAIPSNLPRRHREMLSHAGLEPDDAIELAFGHRYKFDTLYVVGQGSRHDPPPGKMRFLNKIFAPPQSGKPNARVFLARSETKRGRMVSNQDEVDTLLDAFGFKTVKLAGLSVAEQAAVLGPAALVIGSIGTDLMGMFYMRAGARLIALVQDDADEAMVENDVRAIERIGAILKVPVHRFVCASVPRKDATSVSGRAAFYQDLNVDCARLRELLTRLV